MGSGMTGFGPLPGPQLPEPSGEIKEVPLGGRGTDEGAQLLEDWKQANADADGVPTRTAMLARLEEIEKTYAARLAQQKQVIDNLGDARQGALETLAAWQEFGQWFMDNEPTFGAIHARVTDLMNLPRHG